MIVHDVILNAAKIFKVPDEVTDFLKINIEGKTHEYILRDCNMFPIL